MIRALLVDTTGAHLEFYRVDLELSKLGKSQIARQRAKVEGERGIQNKRTCQHTCPLEYMTRGLSKRRLLKCGILSVMISRPHLAAVGGTMSPGPGMSLTAQCLKTSRSARRHPSLSGKSVSCFALSKLRAWRPESSPLPIVSSTSTFRTRFCAPHLVAIAATLLQLELQAAVNICDVIASVSRSLHALRTQPVLTFPMPLDCSCSFLARCTLVSGPRHATSCWSETL